MAHFGRRLGRVVSSVLRIASQRRSRRCCQRELLAGLGEPGGVVDLIGSGLGELGAQLGDFPVPLLVTLARISEQRLDGWLHVDDWRHCRRQGGASLVRLKADLPAQAVASAHLAPWIGPAAHTPAHGVQGDPELCGGRAESKPVIGINRGARVGVEGGAIVGDHWRHGTRQPSAMGVDERYGRVTARGIGGTGVECDQVRRRAVCGRIYDPGGTM